MILMWNLNIHGNQNGNILKLGKLKKIKIQMKMDGCMELISKKQISLKNKYMIIVEEESGLENLKK